MSYREPSLSDLELRYPFAPASRRFFESVPLEDGLSSRELLEQTEMRLMSALGRVKYEPHMSEIVEFSSFFFAALVASQEGFLTSKFSKKEAERAKVFFSTEGKNKPAMMRGCFGIGLTAESDNDEMTYSMPFEAYLPSVVKFGLNRTLRWKLTRQALKGGTVFFNDNQLNDLFGEFSQGAISEGVKNLRKGIFPKQLGGVRDNVVRYVPVQGQRTGKGYLYVEGLLNHPVADGRHRLVWLVLAPYLVNVKKLDDEAAIEKIRAFTSVSGDTHDMRRFVEYNVRRARRNGLLPPTITTLKAEHQDLYLLLPKEVLATEPQDKTKAKQSK